MFRIRKRFGSLALCIALLCMLPVTATAAMVEDCPGNCTHQAAIGTTHYDTIAEAFDAATAGDTITVLTDISTSALTIDKAVTLDLGGMTVTGENSVDEALILTSKDLIVTNGTIVTENGAVLMVVDAALTIDKTASVQAGDSAFGVIARSVDAEASATINGKVKTTSTDAAIATVSDNGKDCDLYINRTAKITAKGNAVEMYDAGKLEITGGTIIANENTVVMDVHDGLTMEAAVTGGKFTAKKGKLFAITAGSNATAPEDFVTGGTFNQDPSQFVPDHCGIIDNGDGTYTVVTSYTITFQSGGAYGTMDDIHIPCGESIHLPQCGFTHSDSMEFAGWEIDGKTYAAGDSFTPVNHTVVTALWNTHTHYGGYATCISPAVCTGCGNTYGQYGDHSLTYSSGYAASCDSTGMLPHSQCVYCGTCFVDGEEVSSFSLATPALGHQWKAEKATAATCTETGIQEHRRCTLCNTIEIDGKEADESALTIPALGHSQETVAAVQATCSQAGVQAHSHCTTCNKYFLQSQEVELSQLTTALASHVLGGDWHSDETYHWKTCVDCDAVFRQSKHADKDADTYCDDCSYIVAVAIEGAEEERSGSFSPLFLIPIAAAVIISGLLVFKKRK